jgi:UDP-glucose 4-epimerase
MTMVADTTRIRSALHWTPKLDNLETIAAHALAWERKLLREHQSEVEVAASA